MCRLSGKGHYFLVFLFNQTGVLGVSGYFLPDNLTTQWELVKRLCPSSV